MKHALRRTLNGINLVLTAGLHGGRVRQNMRVAKTAIAQTWEFVSLGPVAVRVSSMWGFGGNWRGGLPLTFCVYEQ